MSPGEIISVIALLISILAGFIRAWQKINTNQVTTDIKLKELEMKIDSNRIDLNKEQKSFELALNSLIARIEKYEDFNINTHKEIIAKIDNKWDCISDKIDILKDNINDLKVCINHNKKENDNG